MFFTSWLFTSFKKVFKKVCYIKNLRPPSNSREAKNPVFCPFNFAMRVWVNLPFEEECFLLVGFSLVSRRSSRKFVILKI